LLPTLNGKCKVKFVTAEVSYIHTHIYTYIQTYIHTYRHTYIHTYIYTYIQIYAKKEKSKGQDATCQIQGNQVNSITILRFPLQLSTFLPYSVLHPLLYSCLIFLFITFPKNIRFSHYALFITVCLFSCLLYYSLRFYLLFKFLSSSLRVLSIPSLLLLLLFISYS